MNWGGIEHRFDEVVERCMRKGRGIFDVCHCLVSTVFGGVREERYKRYFLMALLFLLEFGYYDIGIDVKKVERALEDGV